MNKKNELPVEGILHDAIFGTRSDHLIRCLLPPNDHWKFEYKRMREQGFTPNEIFEANIPRKPLNIKQAVKKAFQL